MNSKLFSSPKRHTISFRHAFDGIFYVITTQPNFRIHLTAATLVIILSIIFKLTPIECLVIAFTIFWVIISEMINTSLESIVNLITSTHHQEAKIAKDVAAGSVLLSAIGAAIIGCIIFLPRLISIFS